MPARSRCYKQFQYMLNDRKTDSEISKTVASRSRRRVKKKYVAVPLAIKSRRANTQQLSHNIIFYIEWT